MNPAEEVVVLPPTLKRYIRFVVLRDPVSLLKHSYPISGVLSTEGAWHLLNRLEQNVQRRHRKSVFSWLCDSVIREHRCYLGYDCPNVHVTDQGFTTRRLWDKTETRLNPFSAALRGGPKKTDNEECTSHKPYASVVAATCYANWLPAVGLPNILRLRETRMRLQSQSTRGTTVQ